MDDRELTDLAAKAIGLKLKYNAWGSRDARQPFDPLNDDGDAFRLAVNLSLFDSGHFMKFRLEETRANPARNDFVINRRAIVRAAAEIGKTK